MKKNAKVFCMSWMIMTSLRAHFLSPHTYLCFWYETESHRMAEKIEWISIISDSLESIWMPSTSSHFSPPNCEILPMALDSRRSHVQMELFKIGKSSLIDDIISRKNSSHSPNSLKLLNSLNNVHIYDYCAANIHFYHRWIVSGYLEQGLLVRDAKKLRQHYFSTSHWRLDIVSMLPTDLAYLWWGPNECNFDRVPCAVIVRILSSVSNTM